MNAASPDSGTLPSALITEAVRLIEESGPLDDAAAMREAARAHPALDARIAGRAAILGQRIGLPAELLRLRQWAPWIAVALAALVAIAGLALASHVVGADDRRINIMVALASLLGLHLVTLVIWLAGLLLLPSAPSAVSFGGLWMALTARVAGGRHGQAPLLLRAATQLLARARLLTWALGFVSHCIWALSFVAVLGALVFALAFRRYALSWETTILDPGFFVGFVGALSGLPGWLGFPVPDAASVLAPISGAADQRTWALWLTGCIVAYGLLPRLLLALLSAWVGWRRRRALRPDLTAPYFRKLATRFEALAPARIVDADPGRVREAGKAGLAAGPGAADSATDLLIVGFELPPEFPWSSAGFPASAPPALRIDGSAGERQHLIETVERLRPRVLLIVCHRNATPDRGTERLLRTLVAHCADCRLWLWSERVSGAERWRQWLDEVGLTQVRTFSDLPGALQDAG